MFRKSLSAANAAQLKIQLAIAGLATTAVAFASSTDATEDAAFSSMATGIQDIIQGHFGTAMSIIAFAVGLFMFMTNGHKIMGLLVGLGVPIAIHFGPAIFTGLSGAGVVV